MIQLAIKPICPECMLEIPGYRWDEASKRYFKDDRRAPVPGPSAVKTNDKKPTNKASTPASQPKTGLQARVPRHESIRSDGSRPLFRLFDVAATQPFSIRTHELLKQKSLFATFSRLQTVRREQPNLSNGDTITCFDFDKEDPEVLRYGTSAGLLGRGRFVDPSCRQDRSVDEWEMEHILGAPISSVHMHQGFVVHVKFAPRQTSLWSSSIWKTQVALGCDKKVLYARNPADQAFQSFGTGSAVFALDLKQDELFVGTRSGHVRLFDVRQCHSKEQQATSAQVLLRLQSPIVHIRRMTDQSFVVAQMNGSLARYDARYLRQTSEPLTPYTGHVNTQSRALGLDIWNEKILAAAGEDSIVRQWMVSTGSPVALGSSIARSASTADDLIRDFPIGFQPTWPHTASLWVSNGRDFGEYASKV